MEIISKTSRLRAAVAELRKLGRTVGFVPTMGALHHGHASLVRIARERQAAIVASIFVNPRQFAPGEDYESYPRDLVADCEMLRKEGVDLVFAPDADEMYPPGFATRVEVDGISEILIGASRPGHFQGVATVVCKLLCAVRPDFVVLGWKDAQQLVLVTRMVQDLDMGVEIVGAPIVRDGDGLATSSRNARLDPAARSRALAIPRALAEARRLAEAGERSAAALAGAVRTMLEESPGLEVDHVEAVDARTFAPAEEIRGSVLLLVAARASRADGPAVLLLDNLRFDCNASGALVGVS